MSLGLVVAMTACGGSSSSLPPVGEAPARPSLETGSTIANGPATMEHPVRGMPGNGAGSLPGNGAGSLPGALLACILKVATAGAADCTLAINPKFPPLNGKLPEALIPGLHPDDLQNAYALPSLAPGTTVAIVDAYDDPAAEGELAAYRLTFGLPPCLSLTGCFRKVNQRGTAGSYPILNLGWAQEIALDVEMVSAACPRCKILLVEADSNTIDDLGASVDRAVSLGAKVVSNSYYAAEWAGETTEDRHYHHPGVAITVSSGDQPYPYYPAASSDVTAVGGTTLNGSANSWHESAWGLAGHGCSVFEPRPPWQNELQCHTRSAVDMVTVGNPQTGVAMFGVFAGGWVVAGGTSVGAQLIAAAYALSGNPTGPSFAYHHPQWFHNLGPPGYDLETGLGSPIGVLGL